MNLKDISTIRKQFAPLRARYKVAWKGTDPRDEESYTKWYEAFTTIRKEELALCMKYFGHDLYIDGEYLDPGKVLDWIEHFLEAETP